MCVEWQIILYDKYVKYDIYVYFKLNESLFIYIIRNNYFGCEWQKGEVSAYMSSTSWFNSVQIVKRSNLIINLIYIL
jgi:hypothetical protein